MMKTLIEGCHAAFAKADAENMPLLMACTRKCVGVCWCS